MKATFEEITYYLGQPKTHGEKTVHLPFERVSARAVIVRRGDGVILGVRHKP